MKDIGKLWNKKRWYSFCSRHILYNKECNICNTGSWENLWKLKFENLLHHISPKLCTWWLNR